MIETLYNWTAVRSGARITVQGQSADGSPRRVVNIDNIHVRDGGVCAQRSGLGGGEWWLSLQPLPAAAPHG